MSTTSLNDLATELIIQIISSVDLHRSQRTSGHVPDDPPPSSPDGYLIKDFLKCSKALCSLALTCRRFRDTAQEYLLHSPVIAGCIFCPPHVQYTKGNQVTPRIVFLLRTLFERPDLRRHVKQVRLCFREYHSFLEPDGIWKVGVEGFGKHEIHRQRLRKSSDTTGIIRCSHKLIASFGLSADLHLAWSVQSVEATMYGVIGVILALLPELEYLSVSEQDNFLFESHPGRSSPLLIGIPLYDFHNGITHELSLQDIQCLPAASSLRSLKVSSTFALCFGGLDLFPCLDTLDFATKLAGGGSRHVEEFESIFKGPHVGGSGTNLDRIRHLRIDCQVKTAGIWDFAARVSLGHLLRAFDHLTSLEFYAEPSDEKNPFRSVRAFPSSQINIQTYPDEPTPAELDRWSPVWDERVYNARTEWMDYQYLVDSLVHIRPGLQSLKLPGGFWTLPGAMRKPLPSFTSFSELRKLALPQAAILSIKLDSMNHPETEHNDFELLPAEVLPPRLQHLKIFDADADLLHSQWLEDLFYDVAEWPALHTVEILFGPAFDAEKLARLLARKSWESFWTMADSATFRVVVGRDDEVPSISV